MIRIWEGLREKKEKNLTNLGKKLHKRYNYKIKIKIGNNRECVNDVLQPTIFLGSIPGV